MEKNIQPIFVAIKCFTYNHEPYIRQCLEGFVMQQTNFRFVAIIHDDASTDNTVTIIKEFAEKYSDIIYPIYEAENQYSKRDGSLTRIMNDAIDATNCKYIAICEGDDYWIDPLKLQKQVDFLEANPDYGLVHTAAHVYYEKTEKLSHNTMGKNFNNFEALLVSNKICTLTTCFRRSMYIDYYKNENIIQSEWRMGDYPFWLYIASISKVKFLDRLTGVYRVLDKSASHHTDYYSRKEFIESSYQIRRFFAERNNYVNIIQILRKAELKSIIMNEILFNHSISYSQCCNIYQMQQNDFFIIMLCYFSKFSFTRKLIIYIYKIVHRPI